MADPSYRVIDRQIALVRQARESPQLKRRVLGILQHLRAGMKHSPTRWTAAYKAAVVRALENRQTTFAEMAEHYGISPEELGEWQRKYEAGGTKALRATYRRK